MIDKRYRMNEVEEVFSQDRKTIIKRIELYPSHFSDRATRDEGGKQRTFTPRDVRVYATIKRLEGSGKSEEDIALALAGYQEDELEPLPVEAVDHEVSIQVIERQQDALDHMEQRHTQLIQAKEDEIGRLRDQLKSTTVEMAQMLAKREGELQREIGRLEAELSMEKQRNVINHSTANGL